MADDPYLTPAELIALRSDLAEFGEDELVAKVSDFEAIAERARGVAFVPRSTTWSGRPRRGLLELPHVEVTAVASVVDTATSATVAFQELDTERGRLVGVPSRGRLTAEFTHGYATMDPLILEATVEYVDRALTSERSGTSRDVLSQSFDGGTTRYATPDWDAGRFTGYLEVDRLLNSVRDRRVRLR